MPVPAPPPLAGLYAITSDALCADAERLSAGVAAALRGGARVLQYRDKRADAATRRERATALLALCRAHGAVFIVNDDWPLAAAIGADGVHLGASDGDLRTARAALGGGALIGASCGPSLARAHAAAAAGASYLAFGRFYPSRSKPDAAQAEPAVLRAARQELALPLCAIGGITPTEVAALRAAGADLIAAIDGLFGTLDPQHIEAQARAYVRAGAA